MSAGPAGKPPAAGGASAAGSGAPVIPAPKHARPLGPDAQALRRERIVDVLWELQQQRGWIDDEAVAIAAKECGMTPLEVDEVATFYNLLLREPAGRITLFVCDSISCELNGASQLIAKLAERLGIVPGQVTSDGQFGLLPIVCLGHCEKAPCLLAGETVHGPVALDRDAIDRLIQEIAGGSGAARTPR